MKASRGIDLAQTRIPELLAALRLERGWSKAELAEKAGLSAKVIHQIETRSRDIFLEKTLLLVCEALGVNLEEQLRLSGEAADGDRGVRVEAPADDPSGPAPAPGRSRRPRYLRFSARILAFAVLAALFMAVPSFLDSLRSVRTPRVEIVGRTVQASHPASGKLRWSRMFAATINHAEPSPWHDGSVVVGLGADAPDGGRVLLLDGKTGATLWDRSPDVELAIRAFGVEILDGLGSFSPVAYEHIDLDGDGRVDLAVSFMHMRHYPNSIMILGRGGEVLGEFFNRGHVYDMLAVDLDGDGRHALICAGNNNKEPYHGGTVFVLDREHCHGAAVDAYNGGNLEVGDGSRSRILLPSFGPEILGWLGVSRTAAHRVHVVQSLEGAVALMVSVGYGGLVLHLLLDADLNPLAFRPTDSVPITVATWPVDDPATYGPNCPAWRRQWMQEIVQVSPRRLEQLAVR